jgi:hypothetical protein
MAGTHRPASIRRKNQTEGTRITRAMASWKVRTPRSRRMVPSTLTAPRTDDERES